jgi:hypothetical protein
VVHSNCIISNLNKRGAENKRKHTKETQMRGAYI